MKKIYIINIIIMKLYIILFVYIFDICDYITNKKYDCKK